MVSGVPRICISTSGTPRSEARGAISGSCRSALMSLIIAAPASNASSANCALVVSIESGTSTCEASFSTNGGNHSLWLVVLLIFRFYYLPYISFSEHPLSWTCRLPDSTGTILAFSDFRSYSKMVFCRNFQNGVTLLWDQRLIPFTNRGPETFFALTMMSAWIMLSNTAGGTGNVLSAPTSWRNYLWATYEPFTTGALSMSTRCAQVK